MSPASKPRLAVIGGGPAGLMATEAAAMAGVGVDIYDAMPSLARKFLLEKRLSPEQVTTVGVGIDAELLRNSAATRKAVGDRAAELLDSMPWG